MDSLKLSKTVVEVALEDSESFHVGGSDISGSVMFYVNEARGIELKDLVLRLTCDIDISIGGKQAVDTAKNQNAKKAATRKMRIYNQEYPLRIENRKLKTGQHSFPFKIPLPAQHPTLPPSVTDIVNKQTYGNVNYYVKVKAKRATSSWFSKVELKAKCPFMFIPMHFIPNLTQPVQKLDDIDFTSFIDLQTGEFSIVGGILKLLAPSSLRNKSDKKLAMYCTMKVPSDGLRQDRVNQFGLIIRLGDSTETAMIKWVSMSIETVVSLKADTVQSESVISKTPILQKMPLAAGNIIDLSNILTDVAAKQVILPTFTTPLLSHIHRLRLELTVVRDPHSKSGNTAQVVETIPIVVISPHVSARDDGGSLHSRVDSPLVSEYPNEKGPKRKPIVPPRPAEKNSPYIQEKQQQPSPPENPYSNGIVQSQSQLQPQMQPQMQSQLQPQPQPQPQIHGTYNQQQFAQAGPSQVPMESSPAEFQPGEDAKMAPPPSYEEST